MEFADRHGRNDSLQASLRNAPAWVVARVNQARRQVGLPEIMTTRHRVADLRGPFVRWDEKSPHRPRAGGTGMSVLRSIADPLVTRVLMTVSVGQTRAGREDQPIPRTLSVGAFGSARQLNSEIGWTLVGPGHDGAILALAGEQLRAHDSPVGLILEWLPDMGRPDHLEAVRAIEAGTSGVSARYVVKESRRTRLPMPCEIITRAHLVHVALLGKGDQPGMPGSRAKVFRGVRRNNHGELTRHLDDVIALARFHSYRSKWWMP